MKNKELRFKIVDALLIALIVLPLVAGLVIKVLFSVPAEGISITGAQIYFTIPMPIQDFPSPRRRSIRFWLSSVFWAFACS